jgi:hypothetical protein
MGVHMGMMEPNGDWTAKSGCKHLNEGPGLRYGRHACCL